MRFRFLAFSSLSPSLNTALFLCLYYYICLKQLYRCLLSFDLQIFLSQHSSFSNFSLFPVYTSISVSKQLYRCLLSFHLSPSLSLISLSLSEHSSVSIILSFCLYYYLHLQTTLPIVDFYPSISLHLSFSVYTTISVSKQLSLPLSFYHSVSCFFYLSISLTNHLSFLFQLSFYLSIQFFPPLFLSLTFLSLVL